MKKIPFRIVRLQAESFQLTGVKLLEKEAVEVRTSYEFGVNPQAHVVIANLSYTYIQGENQLLKMNLVSTFDVEPEAFQTMLHDKTFTLEPYFLQYLATINVGAARGEIHARCEQASSELADVVLPPINLVEALAAPIVITIQ